MDKKTELKEIIIKIIKGYEHDTFMGADNCSLPSTEYDLVADDIIQALRKLQSEPDNSELKRLMWEEFEGEIKWLRNI